MIDVQTTWRKFKGRWASMRRAPAVFLFAPSPGAEGEAQALAAFALWCEAHAGMNCRVGLSGAWLLHCVPVLGKEVPPIRQQALQQWAHYLDVDEASLERDWVLRDVRLPGATLVCAAPRTLMEGLLKHAADHGVRLVWVGPWWAHGAQAWLNTLTPTVDQTDGLRTLHLHEPGLVTHVQAICSPHEATAFKRIWCDRDERVSQADDVHRVSIHAPDQDDGSASTTLASGLWDHAAVQAVLTGAQASWKAQA